MPSDDLGRERRAFEILQDTLEQPEHKREAFVLEQTSKDKSLRDRVLSLLKAETSNKRFFSTGGASVYLSDFGVPAQIGGYRIIKEIGYGGMGAVYLGERLSDDFDHQVAIKVVRADQISTIRTERLRLERQLLAQLRHPNIAQLYDGGDIEDGHPYFIMEYVEGVTLKTKLIENRLRTLDRFNIFEQIYEAVAYAHTRTIVHRDLSPNNVLIDEGSHVKIIDFGIANVTDASLGNMLSEISFKGTKGYAAPERFQDKPPSTLEDIYSLGAILRNLLEGFDCSRRSDIDAIIHKCMEPDPEQRYQSVGALKEDLTAYRNAEPVRAVGGGWRYQFTRHVMKRKWFYSIATIAMASLLTFTIVLGIFLQRASIAENLAETRFQDVRSIAQFVMFDLHDDVAKLEGSTLTRQSLINQSIQYLEHLEKTASASPDLLLDLAEGYKRLSEVTGNEQSSNLGNMEESIRLLEKAKHALDRFPSDMRTQPRALRTSIIVEAERAARIGFSNSQYEEAVSLARHTQDLSRQLLESEEWTLEDQMRDAYLDTLLSYLRLQNDEIETSITDMQTALGKYENLLQHYPNNIALKYEIGRANTLLGEAMSWQAYYQEKSYNESLEFIATGIKQLKSLADSEHSTPKIQREVFVSLTKFTASGCLEDGMRKDSLSYLDEATTRRNTNLESNPYDQWWRDGGAQILGYRLLCLRGLAENKKAYAVAQEFAEVQRSDLSLNPDSPEQLRWFADGMGLVRDAYQTLEYRSEACEIAIETETALAKRIDLIRKENTDYEFSKREQNRDFLSNCH